MTASLFKQYDLTTIPSFMKEIKITKGIIEHYNKVINTAESNLNDKDISRLYDTFYENQNLTNFHKLENKLTKLSFTIGQWTNDNLKQFMNSLSKSPNSVKIDQTDIHNQTALYQFSINNDTNNVYKLLTLGANPNIADDEGVTPLMNAITNNNFNMVKILVSKGASIKAKDKKNNTVLNYALKSPSNGNIVKFLIDQGAKINQWSDENVLGDVQNLIKGGVDPNIRDSTSDTALMGAAKAQNLNMVNFLLSKRADPNLTNNDGNTALMLASISGSLPIVQLLLKRGAKINMANNDGNTALILAAMNGKSDIVNFLVTSNANYNIINDSGKNVMSYVGKLDLQTKNMLSLKFSKNK